MLVSQKTGKRGINMVALDPFKHELLANNNYDTYGDAKAASRFVKDFRKLPKSSVIAIAVKDEATNRLSGQAKEVLKSLGSQEIDNLKF